MINGNVENEQDLRDWLRKNYNPWDLFWTEAAKGGTPGMPDVFIATMGRLRPVELKAREALTIDVKLLNVNQRKTVQQFLNCEINPHVMWCIKGTPDIWIAPSAQFCQKHRHGNTAQGLRRISSGTDIYRYLNCH